MPPAPTRPSRPDRPSRTVGTNPDAPNPAGSGVNPGVGSGVVPRSGDGVAGSGDGVAGSGGGVAGSGGEVAGSGGGVGADDFATHFPLRYENWSAPRPVAKLVAGEPALVEGAIAEVNIGRFGRGRQMLVAMEDETGDILTLRFFNFTRGMQEDLSPGRRLLVYGQVRLGRDGHFEMAHPKMRAPRVAGGTRLTPVYPAAGKLSQLQIRRLVSEALKSAELSETIPVAAWNPDGRMTLADAFSQVHFPPVDANPAELETRDTPAWRRIRFDELLAHQLVLRREYHRRGESRAAQINPPDGWDSEALAALPFSLTRAQRRAADEILSDIAQARPMCRLLQGEVGSGKTVVAALACLAAAKRGLVSAFMVPTDILASQHFENLEAMFSPARIRCEFLTGAVKGKNRRDALNRLRFGLSHVAVGTHALFQEETALPSPALVVVDEQHRFGVEQRRALMAKSSGRAHQLMMTATPIPRTLMMSAFADLDVSVLAERPPGREPVRTSFVNSERRGEVLERIAARAKEGGAAYWVCPLIEASETRDLQNAKNLIAEAQKRFPETRPALLHGRMASAEKREVMARFRAGEIGLLAATTVIEVGVDAPRADVIVVDHAERMGLSQLHQLRGRVGRGGRPGFCMMIYEPPLTDIARERLRALRESDDGFEIARRDLKLRGAGDWLGFRQSGLPALRAAKIPEDPSIIIAARRAAEKMLREYPEESATHIRRWLGENATLARI